MTDINTFVDDLTRLRDEYKNKIKEVGEETIKSALRDLFEDNDALLAIKWRQYTPYFNDGDECVFGVYDPDYLIDLNKLNLPEGVDLGYYDEWEDSYDGNQAWFEDNLSYTADVDESYPGRYERKERVIKPGSENERYPRYDYVGTGTYYAYLPIPGLENVVETVNKIFTLPDDVFKDVFGDHVEVIVTPEEITVNEYYHD